MSAILYGIIDDNGKPIWKVYYSGGVDYFPACNTEKALRTATMLSRQASVQIIDGPLTRLAAGA